MKQETIDDKIFEFAYTCAMRDATLMGAYVGERKDLVKTYSYVMDEVKEFVNSILEGKYTSQDNYDEAFFLVAKKCKDIKNFKFGNAQKLINMTVKYIYISTYNDDNLKINFKYCHCPMDSFLLDDVWSKYIKNDNKTKAKDFKASWSKEEIEYDSYKDSRYKAFQDAIKELAKDKNCSALEYDYYVWNS